MNKKNKILLIIDPQNDFVNGGALPVAGGRCALTNLSHYLGDDDNANQYKNIYVTEDWHPSNHCSFKENGGIWPAHCVQYTKGAEIFTPLKNVMNDIGWDSSIIPICIDCIKGCDADVEQYSVFSLDENGQITNDKGGVLLDSQIKELKPEVIDICGLAGDYCVLETIKDLMRLYPNIKINILSHFISSIDGGEKLRAFAEENNLNYIV